MPRLAAQGPIIDDAVEPVAPVDGLKRGESAEENCTEVEVDPPALGHEIDPARQRPSVFDRRPALDRVAMNHDLAAARVPAFGPADERLADPGPMHMKGFADGLREEVLEAANRMRAIVFR